MCVTDRYDMKLAVKVALNPNTTNQPIHFNDREEHLLKTFWEKEKMLVNLHFLLFPRCFLPSSQIKSVSYGTFRHAYFFLNFDLSKIL